MMQTVAPLTELNHYRALSGMPADQEPAEFYRREANRIRTMADSPAFLDVRSGLLDMAHRYEAMAEQSAILHAYTFGQPFGRPGQRTNE